MWSAGGSGPEVADLLERVQIDHTSVDVIAVDDRHRLPIGRPYLTPAIDEASRCVIGTVVTLEAPSAISVGLYLAHAAIDKRARLEWRPGEYPFDGPQWALIGAPGSALPIQR